jgi:hypothetical protein
MNPEKQGWKKHFWIESEVDLDFVIGQGFGWPVGMQRNSPAEFKRRVLAGILSYGMQLSSIDYTLKRYVKPETYEAEDVSVGDAVSDYLRDACRSLGEELSNLHTQGELPFGVFGAELTLYRVPNVLDTARMMSNRGLLLEVLPLLRLSLEMAAWAHAAFYISDEQKVVDLRAQSCISSLKSTYKSAGQLYGFLSQFSHWGHAVHREFIHLDEEAVSIVKASVRYRAMSLALCLVILDVFIEVVRKIYAERSCVLVSKVQEVACPDPARKSHQLVSRIVEMSGLSEIRQIQSFLQ